jgi:capsule polysaccharide export protein KpsE/RkpR
VANQSGTTKNSTAGASAQSEPETGERTLIEGLLFYLSILLRYKWLVIATTGAAAVGVLVFSIISLRLPPEDSPLPNYYRAYATLLVSEETGGSTTRAMLSALGVDMPGGGGMNYGQLAQQVLRSRSFLDEIVAEHELIEKYDIRTEVRSSSRELVAGNMTVSYDSATSMLTVGYEDIDPAFARDVANSIVTKLQDWFRSRGGLTRMEELRSLEEKIAEVEEEIARLETEIQAFQREHGVLTVEEIADTQSSMLSDLQSQLVDLEVQIRNQETFSRIDDDPALARLRARKENVIQLIDQIESGYTGGARTMPARSELPQLALEFRRLQTDLEIQQRIYQAISEQYEVSRLTAESDPAFAVLELAEVPDRKAGPSRAQLSMTVTAIGFAAGVALAYIIHFLRMIWADPSKRRLITESLGTGRDRERDDTA